MEIYRANNRPLIAITGKKNSGKTTVIESLIRLLTVKGWRVGTVKHHHHGDFEPDTPGKDSHRHFEAGATGVVLAAPRKLAYFKRTEDEVPSVDTLVSHFSDETNLILLEGFHSSSLPRVEISREDISAELLTDNNELLIAVVTDNKDIDFDPKFGLDQIESLADHLEVYLRSE
ncbi:MAG: molybdopterin-guanine dinucleotide biosynthesis protein B [bacterium]|nr:molybdopterin-guanine dinucleotide biosynthesis protein B [bacterium]